jgi:thiamine biosynthesis lipoprotein
MAERDLRVLEGRIRAWAHRLSRFEVTSDLQSLNRNADRAEVAVRPTLGAMLWRAAGLTGPTEGVVDVTLLEERIAAEAGSQREVPHAAWSIRRQGRGWLVSREGPVRFDLDGVAKGWIADRALALLPHYPAAMVDADGDVAVRVADPTDWQIGIADPRRQSDLAVIAVPAMARGIGIGVGTSGTSVHRWQHECGWAHHLIDPRSGRAALTDVVQATVVAEDALLAEALAKSVVISGSEEGLALAERAGAWAAFLLLESGEVVATPRSIGWLA